MNHAAKLIRFWAMRHPRPSKFRVFAGSEQSIVEVGPRVSWARLAETLEAMEPDRLDALNSADNVIRSCKPPELDDADERDPDEDDPERPQVAPIVPDDPETRRFALFAQLLSKAYEDAQSKVGLRNGEVFDRMIDLFETLGQQAKDQQHALESQNKTIHALYEEQIKQAFERAQSGAEGGGGWVDDLIRPFVEAMREGQAGAPDDEPAATSAPNGKGPH